MLLTSHLAATLLLSQALAFSGPELAAAVIGGVALDLDHLFISRKWLGDVQNFFRKGTSTHGEVMQHSWLQEPLFGLAAGVFIGLGVQAVFASVQWWVFPLSQALHIGMDALMNYEHRPLVPLSKWSYRGFVRSVTVNEAIISSAAVLAIFLG